MILSRHSAGRGLRSMYIHVYTFATLLAALITQDGNGIEKWLVALMLLQNTRAHNTPITLQLSTQYLSYSVDFEPVLLAQWPNAVGSKPGDGARISILFIATLFFVLFIATFFQGDQFKTSFARCNSVLITYLKHTPLLMRTYR